MKKLFLSAIAGAAFMTMTAFAPAQAGVVGPTSMPANALGAESLVEDVGYRRRRRHRGLAAGLITLGIIGAIAANRAHSRPRHYDRHHYRHRPRNRCRTWRRRCYNGNDRACWKFDNRC